MRVAKVWINKFQSGKLLGFADVLFSVREGGNGVLNIKGFKIFRDDDSGGIQIALPSRKDDKGEYRPLVHLNKEDPDATELMNHIKEKISVAYQNTGDKPMGQKTPPNRSTDQIRNDPDPSGIPF